MRCSCDDIGESPCKEHGFGLLECEVCGLRFTAPLSPLSFMLIMCPCCGQYYAGKEENCGPGVWEKVVPSDSRDVEIAKLAYRLGRKDSERYASQAIRRSHTDSLVTDRIVHVVWSAVCSSVRGGSLPSNFDDLGERERRKLGIAAQEALSIVGDVVKKAAEASPEDPICFDAVVAAVDFYRTGGNGPEKEE